MTRPAGAVLGLLMLLAGCASLAPETVPPPTDQAVQGLWRQHQAAMTGITGWRLTGKMALKTASKSGNATLIWSYRRDEQEIELYGPFGSGRVQITAKPGEAVLRDTKGQTITGKNAAQVLHQRLDWPVPFAQLRYWVRGIPGADATPTLTTFTVDRAGRLKTLRQGNWLVEYQGYTTVDQLPLPRQLTVTAAPGSLEIYDRDGAYLGDELQIKIVLKRWRDIQFDH